MQNTNSFNDAACKDLNPNIFFPTRYTKNTLAYASAICDQCSLQVECLFEAVTTSSVGIWAKTTDFQRSDLINTFFKGDSKNFTLKNSQKVVKNMPFFIKGL